MIKDYVSLVIRNIKRRKIRFWLNLIGISIGIAAVILLISLGQGLQGAIEFQAQKVGANLLIIRPGSGELTGSPLTGERVAALYENDTQVIKKVAGAKLVAGVIMKSAQVEFKDEPVYTFVFGTPTDSDGRRLIESIEFFHVMEGRELKETDKQKAVVGFNAANELFKRKIGLGDVIKIEGESFEVVGIQKKSGNPARDSMVRIPLKTARLLFDMPDEFSIIYVRTEQGFDPRVVAESVEKNLRRFRNL